MPRPLFCLIACVLGLLPGRAQETKIFGNAPDYANQEIRLYGYTDYIFKGHEKLTSAQVAPNGDFELSFQPGQTREVFIPAGQQNAFLLAAPGAEYQVSLPGFQPLSPRQSASPYFRPKQVYLEILNTDNQELNTLVRSFDYHFEGYYADVSIRLVENRPINELDSVIRYLDTRLPAAEGSYFDHHKQYRFAQLRHLVHNYSPEHRLERHIYDKPMLFYHPVYNDYLQQTLTDYLYGLSLEGGLNVGGAYYESPFRLWRTIKNRGIFKEQSLCQLSMLYMLREGYLNNKFHHSPTLDLLGRLQTNAANAQVEAVAARLKKEIRKLRIGQPAPDFSLPDADSIMADLSLFRGKYILLHFHSSESRKSLKELGLLKTLAEAFPKYLAVVSIVADENFGKTLGLIRRHDYNWTFLHHTQESDVLEKYNILSYPTYYLLSPEGKLVLAPAPSPDQDLAEKINRLVVKKRREDLRRQGGHAPVWDKP